MSQCSSHLQLPTRLLQLLKLEPGSRREQLRLSREEINVLILVCDGNIVHASCENMFGLPMKNKLCQRLCSAKQRLPLPQPPKNELSLSNIQKWNDIRAHSHLFRITTPIRAGRLRDLLSEHPNRRLVESVDEGLKRGFWPWAVTKNSTTPAIVDNARLQKR